MATETGALQVLPLGLSKYVGVSKLLEALGFGPENLMACGDGENDVQMLKVCCSIVHYNQMLVLFSCSGRIQRANFVVSFNLRDQGLASKGCCCNTLDEA